MKKSDYLHTPVDPFQIKEESSLSDILERMGQISFQGRNLSRAFQIWLDMFQEETTIFLGLAGAMVPAGMRRILVYLIENRLIDCLVSTGANLFHDIHESLGRHHWMGSPYVNDNELKDLEIDRIYDTFASEEEFYKVDEFVLHFAKDLDLSRPYTTRAFLFLLGKHLLKTGKQKGILSAAAEKGIPIYCPAVGDSSIGIALSLLSDKFGKRLLFDPVEDVRETANIVMNAHQTGVIYVGGGTPKNFIQQTEVTAHYLASQTSGHKYAIQFTADAPHWGGLSGCTFEEAQSWGKVQKEARMTTVHADATLVLPLLVSALAEKKTIWQIRSIPNLNFLSQS